MRILVCEDDDVLARGLERGLTRAGHRVERAATVAEAIEAVRREPPGVALVDLTLPDGDGSEIVRALRAHPAVGVVIVSARDEEADRVVGLRMGADDYVGKPFSLAELLARVDALARRTRQLRQLATAPLSTVKGAGRIVLDVAGRTVGLPGGARATLTQKESELLGLLLDHAGSVLSRSVILDLVWAQSADGSSRTLDTHVGTLRAKLGGAATITTVRGAGYRLERD